MSHQDWSDTAPLGAAQTWLLEASAGTGKTYQIASLYLRLVAEQGLQVDGILAITFTEAATSELRDRIRARLRAALDALDRGATQESDPSIDEVLGRILAEQPAEELRLRLVRALLDFDLAPISTIHAFSKRMLDEFAFDSGQEPALDLLKDTSEILEQIVDDALASLYAEASDELVGLFASAGVDRKTLLGVARDMSGAIEPRILPPPELDPHAPWWKVPAGQAKSHLERSRELASWWQHPEHGQRCLDELVTRSECGAWRGEPTAKGKSYKVGPATDTIRTSFEAMGGWIGAFGPSKGAPKIGETKSPHLLLPENWLDKTKFFLPSEGPAQPMSESLLAELDCLEPIRRLGVYFEAASAFWADFAPLAHFAARVRPRVEAELERRRAISFETMLSRLAERVVADGGADSPIANRIRERYQAAFVDEFQDTDAAQWVVLKSAFHGKRKLFLIGDPKQAIYAFRGADLHVYLDAAAEVGPESRYTMRRNWRSDAVAVRANNALFRPDSDAFANAAMDYVAIEAQKPDRLSPPGPGLELRWVDGRLAGGGEGTKLGSKDAVEAPELATREVLAWLSGERGRLLVDGQSVPVLPRDLAVLVSSHHEARALRAALERAGVPVVTASKGSVFETEPARWLHAWLRAVAGAGRDRAARDAATTPLFGWTADALAWALAEADDPGLGARLGGSGRGEGEASAWNAWCRRLEEAASRYERRGFARAFSQEADELGVYPRLLGLPGGERHATDLRHLVELLHVEERRLHLSPARLAAWLSASAEEGRTEVEQRLESDAAAVKIETIHASKGLEYPVVLLPYAWSTRGGGDDGRPRLVRDASRAALDVASIASPQRKARSVEHLAEQQAEELRKLYVALTRAKHRTVVWLGPVGQDGGAIERSAVGRLVFRDPEQRGHVGFPPAFDDATQPGAAYAVAVERLDALVARSERAVHWRPELGAEPAGDRRRYVPTLQEAAQELACAAWPEGRASVASPYRSTSFSALVRHGAAQATGAELGAPEAVAMPAELAELSAADELDEDELREAEAELGSAATAPAAVESLPRLRLGRGTDYGTWVHGVLEALDFETGRGLDGSDTARLIETAARGVGLESARDQQRELGEVLPAILDTPLDRAGGADELGLPAGCSLRGIAAADRLDELAFGLRLGEGAAYVHDAERESPSGLATQPGCVDPEAVYAALLDGPTHRRGAPAAWLEELARLRRAGTPLVPAMTGLLEGSIDLVFRVPATGGAHRYYLADYKTNRIRWGAAEHYGQRAMEAKMSEAGYALQALVYTVALHRFLAKRVRDYDYDRHLGGHLYLFLRGMAGPRTPRDPATGRCHGVYAGRFDAALIHSLDAALYGRGAADQAGASR